MSSVGVWEGGVKGGAMHHNMYGEASKTEAWRLRYESLYLVWEATLQGGALHYNIFEDGGMEATSHRIHCGREAKTLPAYIYKKW